MSDELIKRSDAIEVAKAFWYKPDIAGALAELPTIEPKRGEWIGTRIGHYPGYECSLCHYGVQPWNTTRYCPNCGARMKGADDE
jgi:hypothetical protein